MISSKRIESIDVVRGVVMLLMLLDHTRMYFNREAFLFEPTDLEQTNLVFFFTRWITHFCAPAFVLLAGISARLVSAKLSKKSVSNWLLKRGFWLILLELSLVKFAWLFRIDFQNIDLMVIWGIGASMMFLAAMIWLPRKGILALSMLIIFGHNLLDGWIPDGTFASSIWRILHVMGFLETTGIKVFVSYPILPMIGLIGLGYCIGGLYHTKSGSRFKILVFSGCLMVSLFLVLRVTNWYGDPQPFTWTKQWDGTLMSFLNTSKYPHSLHFILMTIGPTFLLLALYEKWSHVGARALADYGKTPLFFYLVHIIIINILAMSWAVITGYGAGSMIIDFWVTYQPELKGYGVSLFSTYFIAFGIAVILYPITKAFKTFKLSHPDWGWLKYF